MRPGKYRAELNSGNLPPVSNEVVAEPLQNGNAPRIAGYHQVYGDVTFRGEPLGKDATITFPGNGVGSTSIAKRAITVGVLRGVLMTDAVINIAACNDPMRAFVLVDRYAPVDIEIPDNDLTLSIIDTFARVATSGGDLSAMK